MKNKALGVLVVLTVVGSIIGLKAHSAKPPARGESQATADGQAGKPDRTPARLTHLTKAISLLARAKSAAPNEATSNLPEPEHPAEITPTSGRNPDFDHLLETEPENHVWQDQMAAEFAKTYETYPDVHVQSVRCGSYFCRLEMSTPVSDEDQRNVFGQLQHVQDLRGMLTLKVGDDADTPLPVATLYFSKPGVVLPFVPRKS